MYTGKKGAFSAKTGMDIAFAAIFILAIGLTVADDTVTTLALTGTAGTVVGYSTLVISAGFLYGVARVSGIL